MPNIFFSVFFFIHHWKLGWETRVTFKWEEVEKQTESVFDFFLKSLPTDTRCDR